MAAPPFPPSPAEPASVSSLHCLVIFGAAVRADGSASGTLRRRCELALRAGTALRNPLYMPSGGIGRHGPAEARVMRDLLCAGGVADERILVEPEARDTLQSVRYCTRLLDKLPAPPTLVVCSSSYHQPRCVMLLRLAGFECSAAPAASDRPHIGWAKWLRYGLKECLATPWDLAVLWALKMRKAI
jgi:uncharacterized SAM-binding protein YcdF (DUF218 family)